jgi:hypothetical protein
LIKTILARKNSKVKTRAYSDHTIYGDLW